MSQGKTAFKNPWITEKNEFSFILHLNFTAGLHWGPADRRLHFRRHDADPVVALLRAQPPGADPAVRAGHAGAGNDGVAVQERHQAGAH